MRKFGVGVLVGFLASWAVAFASSSAQHDGSFWNRLNTSAKDGYVHGYSDAMNVSVAKLDSLTIAADLFHWKGARKIIRQVSKELSINDLGANDVVKRLDDLYANQKYSELDLGSALQLVTIRARETALPAAEKPDKH